MVHLLFLKMEALRSENVKHLIIIIIIDQVYLSYSKTLRNILEVSLYRSIFIMRVSTVEIKDFKI